jgi:hypothetical protein
VEELVVALSTLRAEFLKAYPAENEDPTGKAKTKAKAFERAVKLAVGANLICAREIDAEDFKTFVWRMDVRM